MITPYITFNGKCKEAIEFYRAVFTCDEPQVMPYGDYMPEGSKTPPELLRTWVMHAEMVICKTNIWFADEAITVQKGDNIKLSAVVPNEVEAAAVFRQLSEGGKVTLSPTKTYYSVFHAAVIDKFGIYWNVIAEESPVLDATLQ